ncbi:MAG: hypothetical protein HC769_30315 [Cyanobacteria bacterium CRU_2_1]|nr:hypothetical protein [Cyanobacteria bacterium CRU_2_1]
MKRSTLAPRPNRDRWRQWVKRSAVTTRCGSDRRGQSEWQRSGVRNE